MSQPNGPSRPTPSNGAGRRVRVIIVVNHHLVSESLGLLLDGQTDMEVVGTATSVAEAALLPRHLVPDVAVMDFHLDGRRGLEEAQVIRDIFPNIRFVFLSRDGSDEVRPAARDASANAYVRHSSSASEVIAAVRAVG